jgi:coenzyme PQQ precursor peptide PqqA
MGTRDMGSDPNLLGGIEVMEWMTPSFEEVDLSCEINSYSSAQL